MQNEDIEIQKKKFLQNEIKTSTISGGFGRAGIYRVGVSERDKNDFKKHIREKLEKCGELYETGKVSEDEHFFNIEKFANEVSAEYGRLLKVNQKMEGRLRIGISQKLLNLYLKYLWCLGWMKQAPWHCPFDSGIISQLGNMELRCRTWTKCDHIDCYKTWVNAARKNQATELQNGSLRFGIILNFELSF